MPRHFGTCQGTIEGLYLPQLAWDVLHRENIRTIGQLRAAAGRLERFDGIGRMTAQSIRQELDRVAAPGERRFEDDRISAWGA